MERGQGCELFTQKPASYGAYTYHNYMHAYYNFTQPPIPDGTQHEIELYTYGLNETFDKSAYTRILLEGLYVLGIGSVQ